MLVSLENRFIAILLFPGCIYNRLCGSGVNPFAADNFQSQILASQIRFCNEDFWYGPFKSMVSGHPAR